jgi:hypothetical protein
VTSEGNTLEKIISKGHLLRTQQSATLQCPPTLRSKYTRIKGLPLAWARLARRTLSPSKRGPALWQLSLPSGLSTLHSQLKWADQGQLGRVPLWRAGFACQVSAWKNWLLGGAPPHKPCLWCPSRWPTVCCDSLLDLVSVHLKCE